MLNRFNKQSTPQEEIFLGQSPDIRKLQSYASRIAKTDEHVLIVGEVGTGARFLAEFIHERSARKNKPLIAVNCTTLVDPEAEIELFGSTSDKGAEIRRTIGVFEEANGGTVLLENVEDLSEHLQSKLITVLKTNQIKITGTEKKIDINVRIISTASTDLSELSKARQFRQDLLVQINSFLVHIPPLRQRKQDIPILFEYFLKKHCQANDRPIPAVPLSIFEPLLDYNWDGNMEELERCVRNLVLLSAEGELSTEFLPFKTKESPFEVLKGKNLPEAIAEVEKYLISTTLRRFGGNRCKAAEHLDVSEGTVRYKMLKLGIPDEFKTSK